MKITTFGAKHFTGQLPRIEEGFRALGHEVVDNGGEVHLVYANDENGARSATDWLSRTSNYPKVIFNCLDIPEHLFPNYDLKEAARIYKRADFVTSISKTTQMQLKRFLGIDSTVIYQPAMPIFQTNEKKYDYKYLLVGRVNDPNKRAILARQYLRQYEPDAKIAIVGSECPAFGDWFGVVSNEALNDLYNSVDYVFSLTKYGGIELSVPEAILAGKFPIVANDSNVALEFASEFATEPTAEGINKKIIEIEQNPIKLRERIKEKQAIYSEWFDKIEVARKILELT